MKLRVGLNPVNLVVSDEIMKSNGGKVNASVLRELASDFSSKLINMSDEELRSLFSSFAIVKENALENPKFGDIIDVNTDEGVKPGLILRINKKTATVVLCNGDEYSCGLGGLIKSETSLEEFKNLRTYNSFNKFNSGCFYKINSRTDGWVSCLMVKSGKGYKLFKLDDLSRYYSLTEDDLINEKKCMLDFNESLCK